MEFRSEHRKAMCTGRETQECNVGTWDRNRNKVRTGTRLGTGTGTGTKLEMVILRMVLVIPEFKCGTKFQESRSQCEAVMAVLQGLMSSEVELVQGCDRGCDRFGTSSGLSAKSHECYGT